MREREKKEVRCTRHQLTLRPNCFSVVITERKTSGGVGERAGGMVLV